IRAGASPAVRFVAAGQTREVRCRLIVGADGRSSAVRAQLGLSLRATKPRTYGAGLLVSGLVDWPETTDALGTEGDRHFFVFPRGGGQARLYIIYSAEQPDRFSGPTAAARFLDAFHLESLPGSDEFAAAEPAGPCAAF